MYTKYVRFPAVFSVYINWEIFTFNPTKNKLYIYIQFAIRNLSLTLTTEAFIYTGNTFNINTYTI